MNYEVDNEIGRKHMYMLYSLLNNEISALKLHAPQTYN